MAIESYTTQLERVQAAIAELEESALQAMAINERQVTYQRLEVLYAREKYLRDQVAAGSDADGPIRVRGLIPNV